MSIRKVDFIFNCDVCFKRITCAEPCEIVEMLIHKDENYNEAQHQEIQLFRSELGMHDALQSYVNMDEDLTRDFERMDKGVREKIKGLPEMLRTIIYLRYYEELSFEQIQNKVGLVPKTLRKMIKRAFVLMGNELREPVCRTLKLSKYKVKKSRNIKGLRMKSGYQIPGKD